MLHLPLLRRGRPYRSLDVARVPHYRTGEVWVEVSQANAGLIRRDLGDQNQRAMRGSLETLPGRERLRIAAEAAQRFAQDTLPLGEGDQTPEDYVRQTAATTGLPHVLVRRNMGKIVGVLSAMETVLRGLTRGLDPEVLDRGRGEEAGRALSFAPRAQALGVVLPSNSPGVHAVWSPAFALKTALVLKPGGAEPWTPYRMVQALQRAGAPPDAFGYYPTGHEGAAEVLRLCGRSLLFGDASSTARWQSDPRVEVHGPGRSKVVLGPDVGEGWRGCLEVMVSSILENGGRSCVNASGIWVTSQAPQIAEALAERLAMVAPRDDEDEQAQLAPFTDSRVAAAISAQIDQGLRQGGAREVTASHRQGGRLVEWKGATYLLPTIVLCDSPHHPLANREFLFPYASVVPVSAAELPDVLGPSLAVTAITTDVTLARRLLSSPLVQRLNLGSLPTHQVAWDQPHEGNLFEHLYARRALQQAPQRGSPAGDAA